MDQQFNVNIPDRRRLPDTIGRIIMEITRDYKLYMRILHGLKIEHNL